MKGEGGTGSREDYFFEMQACPHAVGKELVEREKLKIEKRNENC